MRKKIIVACATGVATSTVIVNRIKELSIDENIPVSITQCKVPEISSYADEADFIVTSGKTPKKYSVPTVNAVSYITGINSEQTDAEITQLLKASN